jgi:hypothetical protein
MRQGRPALHWKGHTLRLEWDKKKGWHFNERDKHYLVRRGLWRLLTDVLVEGMKRTRGGGFMPAPCAYKGVFPRMCGGGTQVA